MVRIPWTLNRSLDIPLEGDFPLEMDKVSLSNSSGHNNHLVYTKVLLYCFWHFINYLGSPLIIGTCKLGLLRHVTKSLMIIDELCIIIGLCVFSTVIYLLFHNYLIPVAIILCSYISKVDGNSKV